MATGNNFSHTSNVTDLYDDVSTSTEIGEMLDPPGKNHYSEIGKMFMLYFAPIALLVGISGNIASLAVMLSRQMRKTSTSIYLAVLAVADVMALTYIFIRFWAGEALGYKFFEKNDILCKLEPVWKRFPVTLAAWIIVSVCTERFIVTWFPLRAPSLCHPKTAKIIVSVLTLLSAAYSLATVLQFGINNGPCDLDEYKQYFFVRDTKWTLTILYSFLPIAILSILSILIAVRLRAATAKRNKMTSDPVTMATNKQKDAVKATVIVLLVSLIYITFTLPSTVLLTLYRDRGPQRETLLVILAGHASVMVNHAINFYLYVLVSRRFRRTFITLFCRSRSENETKMTSMTSMTSNRTTTRSEIELN